MNRRQFIQDTAVGLAAVSLPSFGNNTALTRMGIVVHSYAIRGNPKVESKKYPGFQDALGLIEHCHSIGAGGVQTVVKDWPIDFAKKVRERCEKLEMYLEGSIGLPNKAGDMATFENEVKNAKEAGIQILRTACLSGRRYETFKTAQAFEEFKRNKIQALQWVAPILHKHQIKLAVENHKDWYAAELVEMLKQLGSEWIGATLDFGNNISLLEEPMQVVQTLAPYLISTHIKDMAVAEYEDGFLLSEVPLGQGILDIPQMIAICQQYNPKVRFNLEMITRDPLEIPCLTNHYWATSEATGLQLAQTLQRVKKYRFPTALPRISPLPLEERLATEEANIVACIEYGRKKLGFS
ncbi:MAG: TIM barrel protein [Spirosomataceae bacterium]